MASSESNGNVLLDLNNPTFQENLFGLQKPEKLAALDTLKKIRQLNWSQVYRDNGLKWEKIVSVRPPQGIDAIYCISVNDAFVMNEWARSLNIKNVQVIPDGAGVFTQGMGMTVDMSHIGFGNRSRRYAAVINNCSVEHMFLEPESSAADPDPYGVSSPENVMKQL